jgi:hypothetical protein
MNSGGSRSGRLRQREGQSVLRRRPPHAGRMEQPIS